MLKKEMTPEELQAWALKKKEQQHAAYRRWYESDKGKAYRANRRAKLKLERMNEAERDTATS